MTDRCEMQDCQNTAVGWVEAQWTIVDVVRYECCDECRSVMFAQLVRWTVDGQRAMYVAAHYYD